MVEQPKGVPPVSAELIEIRSDEREMGITQLVEIVTGLTCILHATCFDGIEVVAHSLLMRGCGPVQARERNLMFVRRHILYVRARREKKRREELAGTVPVTTVGPIRAIRQPEVA